MTDPFKGTHTLVTGASLGLGEQFARQIAARGGHLVLTARSRDKLERLAAELIAAHRVEVRVVDADLSTEAGVTHLLAATDALGVAIEHLVSNAGFGYTGALLKADPAEQAAMIRLNCEATVRLTRHFLPAMVARRSGGIIHLASTAAFQPIPYFSTYAASKAFVLSFSTAVAEEVRGYGVRVMALCPGPVPSGFQASSHYQIAKEDAPLVLSAEETVGRGLDGYERHRDVCVTGAMNRLVTFMAWITPRQLLVRQMARAFSTRIAP